VDWTRTACLAVAFSLLMASPGLEAQADGTVTVEGVVRSASGPVQGALVRVVGGESVLTDGAGRFRVAAPRNGPVVVRVAAPGYWPADRTVSGWEPPERLVVELEPDPVRLRGLVATGTPLRGGVRYQPARALDEEALQRRAAVSLGQILDGEPGVAMRSFGAAPARPVIRGLDGDRIAVLENGQRMGDISETAPDHSVALEPLTADGVEVVRGPASLLYGSSALGGVVNVLREDVPRSWMPGIRGWAAAQVATVNREGAVAARGQLGGDRWASAGRLAYRGGGNFRTPGVPRTLAGTHSRRVSAGAGVGHAGDGIRGGLAVDLLGHDFGIPEDVEDPEEQVEIRSLRHRLSGELDWQRDGWLDRVELRAAGTRYVQQEAERVRDAGGLLAEEIDHEFTRHTAGVTLTAGHRPLGLLGEGAVGVSVLSQSLAATGADEFHPDARATSGAVFLFEEIPVSRALRLQSGIRVEAQRMRALPNDAFPHVRELRTAVTVSGSVGANLRPAPGLEVGAQLARAHRAPLVEELYSEGAHLGTGRYEIGNPELANEIGHGVDLFARYVGGRATLELAGFLNRIDQYVILEPTGEVDAASGFPIHRYRADQAELVGGEVSGEIRWSEAITFRGTADYVRGSRRDGPHGDVAPLPYIPPGRAILEGEYDPGRWWLGARARMAASQRRVAHDDPTAGYALLDLHAGFRPVGVTAGHMVVLRMDNALNTAYRDHLSRVEDRRFPMPGRNVSVSFRWRF
jgi:iron complex outermembrane recepter protein